MGSDDTPHWLSSSAAIPRALSERCQGLQLRLSSITNTEKFDLGTVVRGLKVLLEVGRQRAANKFYPHGWPLMSHGPSQLRERRAITLLQ